jgi:hypothetical protein
VKSAAAPQALSRTPFDDVEDVDVDVGDVHQPKAALEGDAVEDVVLEAEPEAPSEPEPMLLTAEPEPVLLTAEPEPVLLTAEPEPVLLTPEPEPVLLTPEPEPAKAPEPAPEPEPAKAAAEELTELELTPEPEAELTPEPEAERTPEPEAELTPVLEAKPEPQTELTPEPAAEPRPAAEARPEAELTPEPEAPLAAEVELTPEPEEAPAREVPAPEPVKAPPRDETTESGVWALDGSQPKAPEAEAPAPAPEPEAVARPRQPIDLGELPPAPEEPMQLAATWEFMGMAEAQGHAAAPTSEERGMELDLSTPSSAGDTGSPQDEVALASTWDFVPQWQPRAPAPSGEASPPSASVAEKAAPSAPVVAKAPPSAPVSTEAPVDPVTTAKYGIGTGEPAAPEAKADVSWDQMFPPDEPASPAAAAGDPFTEFATEAARKRDEKPTAPSADEEKGPGSST